MCFSASPLLPAVISITPRCNDQILRVETSAQHQQLTFSLSSLSPGSLLPTDTHTHSHREAGLNWKNTLVAHTSFAFLHQQRAKCKHVFDSITMSTSSFYCRHCDCKTETVAVIFPFSGRTLSFLALSLFTVSLCLLHSQNNIENQTTIKYSTCTIVERR